MHINCTLSAIYTIDHTKAFCSQRHPKFTCIRKETGDIEILMIPTQPAFTCSKALSLEQGVKYVQS